MWCWTHESLYICNKLREIGGVLQRQPKLVRMFGRIVAPVVSRMRHIQRRKQEEVVLFGNPEDTYLKFVYKVFSWDDPRLTLAIFLASNFLFWLAVILELRLFGVFFLLAFGFFVVDMAFDTFPQLKRFVQPTMDLYSYNKFHDNLVNFILFWQNLRKESPPAFCAAMSTIFLLLSLIAQDASGYILLYFTLLFCFLFPFVVQKAPDSFSLKVETIFKTLASNQGILAEEELFPYIADKDLNERDPDLDSLLTDKTADSLTSSLMSGISQMPSIWDVADGGDIQEEDLLLNDDSPSVPTHDDLSTDSEDDHQPINFEAKHFNGDSSSEEDKFAKNLNFSGVKDLPEVPVAKDGMLSSIINVATASGSMVANAIKTAVSSPPPPSQSSKSNDSDSDFEIINTDDMDL